MSSIAQLTFSIYATDILREDLIGVISKLSIAINLSRSSYLLINKDRRFSKFNLLRLLAIVEQNTVLLPSLIN